MFLGIPLPRWIIQIALFVILRCSGSDTLLSDAILLLTDATCLFFPDNHRTCAWPPFVTLKVVYCAFLLFYTVKELRTLEAESSSISKLKAGPLLFSKHESVTIEFFVIKSQCISKHFKLSELHDFTPFHTCSFNLRTRTCFSSFSLSVLCSSLTGKHERRNIDRAPIDRALLAEEKARTKVV